MAHFDMTDIATKVCAHEGLKSGVCRSLLEVFSNEKGEMYIEMVPTTIGCVQCNNVGRITLKWKANVKRLIRVTKLLET